MKAGASFREKPKYWHIVRGCCCWLGCFRDSQVDLKSSYEVLQDWILFDVRNVIGISWNLCSVQLSFLERVKQRFTNQRFTNLTWQFYTLRISLQLPLINTLQGKKQHILTKREVRKVIDSKRCLPWKKRINVSFFWRLFCSWFLFEGLIETWNHHLRLGSLQDEWGSNLNVLLVSHGGVVGWVNQKKRWRSWWTQE